MTPFRRSTRSRSHPIILLGTTAPVSLGFLRGFPEYLNSMGWEVHVVSSSGRELDKHEALGSATVHRIEMERNPRPLSDAKALLKWLRLMLRVRPDIVVVGTPKAGLLSMISATIAFVPIRIYHLWGLRVETTKGLVRILLTATERVTCRIATQVLLVSPSLGRAVLHARLAPRQKMKLVGPGSSNGIDLEYFDPSLPPQEDVDALKRELAISADDYVVGYVGRVHPDKGLDYLIEAVFLLARLHSAQSPDRSRVVKLLIVGDFDDPHYRPFVHAEIPVLFVGSVADTRPYYRLMDVVCLPTLREGLPNVPLEAAAMGVPVVTTNATGAQDSVSDGITGLVVPTRNASALADALGKLIAEPQTASVMGTQGQRWVRQFERRAIWSMQEAWFSSLLRKGAE